MARKDTVAMSPLLNSDGSRFEPPASPAPRQPSYEELAAAFYRRYHDGLAEWERWRQARREQQEQGDDDEEIGQP